MKKIIDNTIKVCYTENMKKEITYMISHLDLDGYGTSFVAKKFFTNIYIKNINYPDVLSEIKSALSKNPDRLIISDIWADTIDEETKKAFKNFKGKLLIFDHHISSVESQREIVGMSDRFQLIYDNTCCATASIATHFEFWLPSIGLINKYDMTGESDDLAGQLNTLFWEIDRGELLEVLNRTPFRFTCAEMSLLDKISKNQEELYKKVLETLEIYEVNNYSVAFIECAKYKSYILNRFLEKYDPVIMYDFNKETYSIRSLNPIASTIAEAHGGGGHEKAAGISQFVEKEALKKTIKKVVE